MKSWKTWVKRSRFAIVWLLGTTVISVSLIVVAVSIIQALASATIFNQFMLGLRIAMVIGIIVGSATGIYSYKLGMAYIRRYNWFESETWASFWVMTEQCL